MDEISAILTTLPNLAIAIWVIWQNNGTISKLLENQQHLIEKLMSLYPPVQFDTTPQLALDTTT
jgi:hypothetical protein